MMGNDQSSSEIEGYIEKSRLKVFGLHGWRTNAKILKMQTAAMVYHTKFDLLAVNAPFDADGPPDQGIGTIYPNENYYQWYNRKLGVNDGLESTIDFLSNIFNGSDANLDGSLGFSQGAGVLSLYLMHCKQRGLQFPVRFVILIGGIEPPDHTIVSCHSEPLDIPSLHIIGRADPLLYRSERLLTFYNPDKATILYHSEGHNIPSIRTQLYPTILMWLESLQ
jgi:predicted esterase